MKGTKLFWCEKVLGKAKYNYIVDIFPHINDIDFIHFLMVLYFSSCKYNIFVVRRIDDQEQFTLDVIRMGWNFSIT